MFMRRPLVASMAWGAAEGLHRAVASTARGPAEHAVDATWRLAERSEHAVAATGEIVRDNITQNTQA